MATPNTKDTLKEYCLRALGKPVIEVNVDEDQVDDRLDEALQYFAEYHMDGVERVYLKHQVTDAHITRARTDSSENVTDAVDNAGGAYAWKEQKVWIPVPASVVSIVKVLPMTNSTSSPLFDVKYQMRINELWDFTSSSIVDYQIMQNHVDFIDHVMTGEAPIRFNVHQNRLYIDRDWEDMVEDRFVIIECYRKLNPTSYTDVYNDMFLKKYATALIKKQWGANLIKFQGVTMLGGVQMNGEIIYQQADEEIKLLEEQMLNGFGLPADMMIG